MATQMQILTLVATQGLVSEANINIPVAERLVEKGQLAIVKRTWGYFYRITPEGLRRVA